MNPELIELKPNLNLSQPSISGELVSVEVDYDDNKTLTIDTYGVNGRSGGSRRTILAFQPWSDYSGREFMQRRLDAVAEATNAIVVSVDNLGVGTNTSSMPRDIKQQVRSGDFSELCELTWDAVLQNPLVDVHDTDELILGYHSLGATIAAEMTAYAPEDVEINRLMLLESVTLREQSFGSLMLKYGRKGADQIGQYMGENPDWMPQPTPVGEFMQGLVRQAAGHYTYPRGMARRPLFEALEEAREREVLTRDSLIHLSNGSRSELSPTSDNDAVAEKVRKKLGLAVCRTILYGETHPINDSIPRAVAYLESQLA